jgi:alanyl-tRNA synthetase
MTVRGLREKYLAFFESKGHVKLPSGSLIPYDVTGRLDESLLFNGAGMIQFKPYFRGTVQPENRRVITAQKCVRTGDIEIVGDATHLTFFEMMGNFSFGDYFKAEAIDFSWEFLTSPIWLALDPRRIAVTIFEEDNEAYDLWSIHLESAGVDPSTRIFRLSEESNYWPAGALSSGPPGPCGPNSEMFYWTKGEAPTGPYTREDFLADDERDYWVEIWNDVFIDSEWQGRLKNPSRPSDGYIKEGMPGLPFKSIDTGMGLERTAMVLGGFSTVFESDVFTPILGKVRSIAGNSSEPAKINAERVIADHIRTAAFCIADGVFPSNGGRGYVLRRLIRRAVLKGQRVLGLHRPFFADVFEGVRESMGDFYPELIERKHTIEETLANEEAQFRRTLSSGSTLLEAELSQLDPHGTLPGAIAFRLYDTFGFPIEVTQEIAAEGGFEVDFEGYEIAMVNAQERSRSSQSRESVYGGVTSTNEMAVDNAPSITNFVGYLESSNQATITRVRRVGPHLFQIALDRTPFYAESGGQAGDQGSLRSDQFELRVKSTSKSQEIFWHEAEFQGDPDDLLGQTVTAAIDEARRDRIRRNHTATHLLHAALRATLGNHVAQAGSFVGPDGLRFDFSHNHSLGPDQLSEVESMVNREALANHVVNTYVDLPIEEARSKGAMALFGQKYGKKVRMVEIAQFSRELCGGTHVRTTGEIGIFLIMSEVSAASGIRRIEAVTGEAAYQWTVSERATIRQVSDLLRSTPTQLVSSTERVLEQLKAERRSRERAESSSVRTSQRADRESAEDDGRKVISGVSLWVKNFRQISPKVAANELDNAVAEHPDMVGLVATINDGKVSLFAKVGPGAIAKGAHAGKLIQRVAAQVGGQGGGRPEFATAGGKDPANLDRALDSVSSNLAEMLNSTGAQAT